MNLLLDRLTAWVYNKQCDGSGHHMDGSVNGKPVALHATTESSILSPSTPKGVLMKTEQALLEQIKRDAECLWEIAYRAKRGETTASDLVEGRGYCRDLKAALAEYYERRFLREECLVWFAQQAIDAFQNIYATAKPR